MTEYELSQLPKSKTGKRMISRVSPIYGESFFMKSFYDALGNSFDKIRYYFEHLREQSFNETVDWGIEYREHKYSLEPRPDLTLEERRARLKIKATQHYPLNPARLENDIYELYKIKSYLDERSAGYINAILNNLTPEGWKGMLDYLLREKPAHLALKATLHIVEYGGEGEKYPDTGEDYPYPDGDLYDPDKVYVPDDSSSGYSSSSGDSSDSGSSSGDSSGSGDSGGGSSSGDSSGGGSSDSGSSSGDFSGSDDSAGGDDSTGKVIGRADDDVPYIPRPTDDASKLNFPRLFFGVPQYVSGVHEISLPKPKNIAGKFNAGVGTLIHGKTKLEPTVPHDCLIKLHAGVGISISGEIKIGTADKPNLQHIR